MTKKPDRTSMPSRKACPKLDLKHVIFGRVLEGMSTIRRPEAQGRKQDAGRGNGKCGFGALPPGSGPSSKCLRYKPTTLPKTNIAPENRPLEEGIPIGNHHFQVLC